MSEFVSISDDVFRSARSNDGTIIEYEGGLNACKCALNSVLLAVKQCKLSIRRSTNEIAILLDVDSCAGYVCGDVSLTGDEAGSVHTTVFVCDIIFTAGNGDLVR